MFSSASEHNESWSNMKNVDAPLTTTTATILSWFVFCVSGNLLDGPEGLLQMTESVPVGAPTCGLPVHRPLRAVVNGQNAQRDAQNPFFGMGTAIWHG